MLTNFTQIPKIQAKILSIPLFIILFLLLNIPFVVSQAVVTDMQINQGSFNYITTFDATNSVATQVPLNNFQIVITFDRNVSSSSNASINTKSEAGKMFDLRVGDPITGATDLFTGSGSTTLDITNADVTESNGGKTITINVKFFNDLKAGETYTLSLVPSEVKDGGDLADPFKVVFTTPSAPSITQGTASADLCQTEIADVTPIIIGEASKYTFVRNTTGTLTLTLSNTTDFEFVTSSGTVSKLGTGASSFTKGTVTTTEFPVIYTIANDGNIFNSIYLSDIQVKFKGSSNATTSIIVKDDAGRLNINGMYSNGNTGTNSAIVLGTVTGKASITDNTLDAPAMSGTTAHCVNGANRSYLISPVSGATEYEWTVPTNFTPQGAVTSIGGNKWTTTTNYIIVKPTTVGSSLAISVVATNNCRRGASSSKTSISITDASSPIADASLDASAITGTTTHCTGDAASVYFTPVVSGATKYEWTVPNKFTVTGATSLGSNVWETSDNFITLTPASAGTNISLSVTATNDCKRGTVAGTKTSINIYSPTAAGSISFSTPTTGSFVGTTASPQSIANNAGTQTVTVSGGSATFSGAGMVGNVFYPSIVSFGEHTISYVFTNTNGCTTSGSFKFSVFDAGATITGVLTKYCNNETTDQEFKVKTSSSGVNIPSGNVVLKNSGGGIIGLSAGPTYTSGFGYKGVTGSDHVFVIKPNLLATGTYSITVTTAPADPLVTPTVFTASFAVNAAPAPSISGSLTVCANASSTYSITPGASSTYAWALSGGGNPASGNGSSITINWNAATSTNTYTLSVTETNTLTGCSEINTKTISVNGQPSPTITSATNGLTASCAGATQSYEVGGGVTAGHNYLWEVSGGSIVTQAGDKANITVKWGTGTGGTVKLTQTNAQLCVASTSTAVTINALPVPSFAPEAGGVNKASACVQSTGQAYTVTLQGGNSVTASWEVDGGTIVGGSIVGGKSVRSGTGLTSVTIDWGSGVQGIIKVTETSANTCDGIVTKTVTLNPLPSLTFSGLAAQYCEDAGTVNLVPTVNGVAVPIPANGKFIIRDASNTTDVDDLGANTNTFVIDPVAVGALRLGNYNLVFQYTDVRGCFAESAPAAFQVQTKPVVVIASASGGLTETCASANQTYEVSGGITTGHTYTWNVTGGIVIAQAADKSQITVTWGVVASGTVVLTETNTNACQASVTANVTINPLPAPTFATAASSACVLSTNEAYSINTVTAGHVVKWEVEGGTIQGGTLIGAKSTLSGADINDIKVDWGSGAQGIITVTETDAKPCSGTVKRIITLNPLPSLSFSGLGSVYCEDAPDITLTPSVNGGGAPTAANGLFVVRNAADVKVLDLGAGNNVLKVQDVFNAAGAGDYKLVYQYTDAFSCFAESLPVTFKVNPVPKNVKLYISRSYDSRNVIFNASADGITSAWSWDWTFAGASGTTQQDTLVLADNKPQSITYSLLITNTEGCTFNTAKVFNIDYSFAGKCLGSPTQFTDATDLGSSSISSWSWDFGDGNSSTVKNPSHTYAAAGTYFVVLTVTDGIISYSLRKRIDIFPVVTVTPSAFYTQDFSGGAAGWISHGIVDSTGISLNRTSWKLQTPAGFGNIPADKGNAWVTNNTIKADTNANFYASEQSYVESPCFDINALNRPMLSFNYWSDTDQGSDGVALFYTIDDGATWLRVGETNQGIDWYDTSPILGKPGNDFSSVNVGDQGWSGNAQTTTTKAWKTARFGLDAVLLKMSAAGITNKIVRFRVGFGSNADNTPNVKFDGFAFDDFQVSNRNRLVLMEYFINENISGLDAATLDANAHAYASSKSEAINIHYHTGFPGADAANVLNTKDPSGRAFHYGVRAVPRPTLDGEVRDQLISGAYAGTWIDTAFARRTLLASPFLINIAQPTASNGVLTVSATVNAIEALNRKVVMHIAVIEDTVTLGTGTYYNVVRKMLPDAAGTYRAQSWALGDNQTLNHTWSYGTGNTFDPQKFRVIVFVADYVTHEIYQAEVSEVQVNRLRELDTEDENQVTGINNALQNGDLQVYPNPTAAQLNVSFQNKIALATDANWEIMTVSGQTVKTGRWKQGSKQLSVNVANLAAGVYIIKIHNDKTTVHRRFEKH